MRFASFVPLALAASACAVPHRGGGHGGHGGHGHSSKDATTTIAGVEVIDTPVVRAVRDFIESYYAEYQPYLTGHLYRTWLFGAAAINNQPELKETLDLEVHAVGCMLHDVGWDIKPNSPFVTGEYSFEIDSGRFAVEWIKNWTAANGGSEDWDEVRLNKVYQGIMLQTFIGASEFSFPEVHWITTSVGYEFPVPESPLVGAENYDNIWAAYPNSTLFRGTNFTFTNMAVYKPAATYTTFISGFGDAYVPGYDSTPYSLFNLIQGGVQLEVSKNPDVPFVQKLPPNGGNPLEG